MRILKSGIIIECQLLIDRFLQIGDRLNMASVTVTCAFGFTYEDTFRYAL